MKKIAVILLFIFTSLPVFAFSQTWGCLRGGYIYFVLDAEGDYRDGYIQYEMNYYSERIPETSTCYRIADPYPSCYVDNNIGSGSGLGTLVTYGTVYCSIDDNTWALLAFSIIPVFVFGKKLFG